MSGGERGAGSNGDGTRRRRHAVHLEGCGDVDLPHPGGETDADHRPEPRQPEIEADPEVRDGQALTGDPGGAVERPARELERTSHPLRLGRSGQVLDQPQRARYRRADPGGGRHPTVLDIALTVHPGDLRIGLSQRLNPRPVAGSHLVVQQTGRGQKSGPRAHRQDVSSAGGLADDPGAQRRLGLAGGLFDRGDDHDIRSRRSTGVHHGEGERGDEGRPAHQPHRVGGRRHRVHREPRGAGEDLVRRQHVAGVISRLAEHDRHQDRSPSGDAASRPLISHVGERRGSVVLTRGGDRARHPDSEHCEDGQRGGEHDVPDAANGDQHENPPDVMSSGSHAGEEIGRSPPWNHRVLSGIGAVV